MCPGEEARRRPAVTTQEWRFDIAIDILEDRVGARRLVRGTVARGNRNFEHP